MIILNPLSEDWNMLPMYPHSPLLTQKYLSTIPRFMFRSNSSIQYPIPWTRTLEGSLHAKRLKGPINKMPCLTLPRYMYQIWRIWICNCRFLLLWKSSLAFLNLWGNHCRSQPHPTIFFRRGNYNSPLIKQTKQRCNKTSRIFLNIWWINSNQMA